MTINPFHRRILVGLNSLDRHVYAGTVDPDTIARRRAANKRARVARRLNRSTK